SRLQAAGDVHGMMEMNSRANVIVGTLLFPLLAIAFVFAADIVTVVYTAAYVEAVPAMRLYVLGMVAMVIGISSVVLLLRQGPFAFKVSLGMLAFSVATSLAAAQHFGLVGAAAGSVFAIYFDRVLVLRRISQLTGIGVRRMQDWRALARALAASVL